MSVEFTRESWDLHVRATAVPDRLCALDLTIASAAAFSGFSSFKDAKGVCVWRRNSLLCMLKSLLLVLYISFRFFVRRAAAVIASCWLQPRLCTLWSTRGSRRFSGEVVESIYRYRRSYVSRLVYFNSEFLFFAFQSRISLARVESITKLICTHHIFGLLFYL